MARRKSFGQQALADAQKLIAEALQIGRDLIAEGEDDLRRLSPKELKILGASPRSRRYVKRSVKRVTKRTKSISHRAYETKRLQGIKRETATKLRERGELRYRSETAKETAAYTRKAAKIRRLVPGVAPRDVRLINAFREHGYEALADIDPETLGYDEDTDLQEEFRKLFKRYSRDQVLEAMGSPVTTPSARKIRRAA